MDRALKERKMASASMRKQRIQERQKHKDMMHEQREERKRRMMRISQAYSSDASDDSDSSRPHSPANDSSAETPSEYSLRTPENISSPDVAIQGSVDMTIREEPQKEDEATIMTKPTILERRQSKPISAPKQAMFGSSLNRPCDFRYDRFSTFVEPIEIPQKKIVDEASASSSSEDDAAEEAEDDDDDDDDDEDDYSPIELATPVAIRMPISRPSVVAVVGATAAPQPGPQKFSVKNINTIMINPPKQPTPKPRIVETLPTPEAKPQTDYAFPSNGAKPVEKVVPSSSSVYSVDQSSTRSRPGTATQSQDQSIKKKSSMPMLTKFTHARMNSIKNFMKPQSISGPPPAVPMIPSTHQPRPSESMSNILLSAANHRSKPSVADKLLPPSPRRSLTEPTLLQLPVPERRPQTARSHSQNILTTLSNHSSNNITALPTPKSTPAPPMPQPAPAPEEVEGPTMNRKKSFSSFRRRSGSLGQALKFGNSTKTKPATPEAPLPPMPSIKVPTQESVPTVNYPSPPPKTPRSTRKSGMMYSPFPPAAQKGEPVGLGLRM